MEPLRTLIRPRAIIPKGVLYSPLGDAGPRGTLEGPERFTIEVSFEGHSATPGQPGLMMLRLSMELQNGRFVVVHLEADGPPGGRLDIELIREFAFGPSLRQSLFGTVRRVSDDGEVFSADRPMTDPDPLWQVALIYTVARAIGENPTAAVAHDLQITQSAAAQRVRRSRAKGFLPPTTAGKAS